MKKFWIPALLTLLLLAGCGTEPAPAVTTPPEPSAVPETSPAEPTGYYDPQSQLEGSSNGAVKAYPLNRHDATGVIPMDGGLLLLTGTEFTTLTRLTGSNLHAADVVHLNCSVLPDAPDLQVSGTGITYYDEFQQDVVFLDGNLKEVKRIPLPDTITGRPAVTADRNTIYYCTADSLRCIDLETNLDRLLREMSYDSLTIKKLHCNDTIIQCLVTLSSDQWRCFYISAETGETLWQTGGSFELDTLGDTYFASTYDGDYQELLTGVGQEKPALLIHEELDIAAAPALEFGGAILVSSSEDPASSTLDFYDLSIGDRSYSLTLDAAVSAETLHADPAAGCVWGLCFAEEYQCDTLFRWDLYSSAVADDNVYRRPRYTSTNPDTVGLEACRETADQISAAQGVEILLWSDAVSNGPWDYDLEAEYQVPLIQHNLEVLDKSLSQFPPEFLMEMASGTGSEKITISLVRSITGNPDANALDQAVGIQYWGADNNAVVVLTVGSKMQQSLYHELFHIIDSYVMSNCSAYDTWSILNPKDFEYDYDYEANLFREDYHLLEGANRAFIDIYSMSFPKEDRARIFEYAMMPDNETYFESQIMQSKLSQLCAGIRKAFGLKQSEEVFPWEQYLTQNSK